MATAPGGSASAAEAARTLEEVERLRRSTRQLLAAAWMPLMLFGALAIASAPFTLISDGWPAGAFWVLAAPLGMVTVMSYYRRRSLSLGLVDRHWRVYPLIGAGIFLVAFILGWAGGGGVVSQVGPAFAVGLGTVAFGLVMRVGLVTAGGAAIVATAAVVLAVHPDDAGMWAALAEGGLLLLFGGLALAAVRRA